MTTTGHYTETMIEVANVQLQLRQGGAGAPLLILHGELGVPGWLPAYELLAEHFTVYVPSLPGFGRSARPDWLLSVRDMAAWVSWFARALPLPQPLSVLGCSMGGWLAAEIATVHASLFKKMVLVGAAGLKPDDGDIWDYFVHAPRDAFRQAFYDPEHSPAYAQYYGASWTPEDELQAEGDREMASRLLWKPYMRSHTLSALLGGVATPTLLVWGREDAIVPLSAGRLYARAIPGAALQIIERCGHLPEMEKPEEFARLVLDFLSAS